MRGIKICFIMLMGIAAASLGGWLGYVNTLKGEENVAYGSPALAAEAPKGETVGENTVMEFVYNYNDGFSETIERLPQYYMYGWDREDVAQAYDTWQMTSFSDKRIIFNKNMNCQSSQHYTLKAKDGYVAVYYKESDALKEITSTPIASLSETDKKLFEQGVDIDGELNLMRYLESLET